MASSLLDRLCSVVWYKTIALALDAKSPNAVATKIDALRYEDIVRRGVKTAPNFDMKSFAPYAKGNSAPSKPTIHMVEELLAHLMPNTSHAFYVGPFLTKRIRQGDEEVTVTQAIPLWVALAGPAHALRSVLSGVHEEFQKMLVYGSDPIEHANNAIEWIPIAPTQQAFIWVDDGTLDELHLVDRIYKQNKNAFNLEQLTLMVLLWRYSMLTQRHFPFFNYVMRELYLSAIPDVLAEYGIADEFIQYCKLLERHYFSYLKKLESGEFSEEDEPLVRF